MPAPGYQRDDWSSGVSLTASTFGAAPKFRSCRSSEKLLLACKTDPTAGARGVSLILVGVVVLKLAA